MARRRGVGQASDYLAEFTPPYGMEIEAKIGTNGLYFQDAFLSQCPKHWKRWLHAFTLEPFGETCLIKYWFVNAVQTMIDRTIWRWSNVLRCDGLSLWPLVPK